jgi:hypothetical protein
VTLRILLEPIFSKDDNGDICTVFHIASLPDPFHGDNLNYGSERQAKRKWNAMCYPGLKSLYLLSLEAVRNEYRDGPNKDWIFLEWIRQASHVSTSFRHELGQVLWANTVICASGYEIEDEENRHMEAIEDLLRERPSVLDSVRSLSINFEIPSYQDVNEDEFFDDWCDYIAKSLDLETVWFRICVRERDLKRFVNGKKSGLNGLSATSKL